MGTGMDAKEFFAATGPMESQRYKLAEVIGKGSYGVVASAVDQFNSGARLCAAVMALCLLVLVCSVC